MRRQDRNPGAYDLRGVHVIAAYLGQPLHDGRDLDAGLKQLVADDESDVAGAYHEDAPAGSDAIDVHERLDRPRTVDAREVAVGKRQHVLGGARRQDDRVCRQAVEPVVPKKRQHPVGVEAEYGRACHDADRQVLDLLQ